MDTLEKIRLLCEERNWSHYKLSQKSGVPHPTLKNMYKRNTLPTLATLESICNGLGLTLAQFFANENEPVPLTKEQREILMLWGSISQEEQEAFKVLLKKMAYSQEVFAEDFREVQNESPSL